MRYACAVVGLAAAVGAAAPVTPPPRPEVRMPAGEFVARLRADPRWAGQMDGRRVELTGQAHPDWVPNRPHGLSLAVPAALDGGSPAELACEVPAGDRPRAWGLRPDQPVRVTGTFARDEAADPPGRLKEAAFEATGPSGLPTVTADELAQQVENARKSLANIANTPGLNALGVIRQSQLLISKKLSPFTGVVTGKVAKVSDGTVVFAVEGKPPVGGPLPADQLARLKPGDAVRVKCKGLTLYPGGGNGPLQWVEGSILLAAAGD